jgi:membrane dipeptidase
MLFFDAHCDTIGPIWEGKADFAAANGTAAAADPLPADKAAANPAATDGATVHGAPHPLHITLPGLKAGHIGAQVFASWVWSAAYHGREYEVGMAKVRAVRQLCADYPEDLALALAGADLAAPFKAFPGGPLRIAVIPALEGADPLLGDVDNLFAFYDTGVRLITLAWGDNAFGGSVYGEGLGLTRKGADLVAACESLGVMVDVSHLSDRGFRDVCDVAERPFVASHSNCRSLCSHPRNLTDDMIRTLGDRGGVVGISVAPEFLSEEYYRAEDVAMGPWYADVSSGRKAFDEIMTTSGLAMDDVPRPPIALIADHIKWAINCGGEDSVGLGGDLDGIDRLPAGLEGVADYPRIEELLRGQGLTSRQVEKVCYENFLRVFQEVLG